YQVFSYNNISFEYLDRKDLWKNLSYIPQHAQIFSNSIKKNVSPQNAFDQSAILSAIENADLTEDLKEMPEGMDSLIGEKGLNLSGGQKQRLSIARSFHSKAQIYLWDDC